MKIHFWYQVQQAKEIHLVINNLRNSIKMWRSKSRQTNMGYNFFNFKLFLLRCLLQHLQTLPVDVVFYPLSILYSNLQKLFSGMITSSLFFSLLVTPRQFSILHTSIGLVKFEIYRNLIIRNQTPRCTLCRP